MFIVLLACKYGLWMVPLRLHSWDTPPQTPPPLFFFFFFFFTKVTFWQCNFSLFGGGWLGLLDLDLPPNCVCSVKASASHGGYSLSTAEDSKHGQNKPLSYCISIKQHTHTPRIDYRTARGRLSRTCSTRLWGKSPRHKSNVRCFSAETLKMNFMWWKKKKKTKTTVKWNCYCWLTCVLGNLSPKLSCNLKGNGEFYSNECNNGLLWSLHCVPKHVSRVGQLVLVLEIQMLFNF